MEDEGEKMRTTARRRRTTARMGWTGTRLMAAMGGSSEGQNGNGDKKIAIKMAKERAGRRG